MRILPDGTKETDFRLPSRPIWAYDATGNCDGPRHLVHEHLVGMQADFGDTFGAACCGYQPMNYWSPAERNELDYPRCAKCAGYARRDGKPEGGQRLHVLTPAGERFHAAREPRITINGTELTPGQAMTLRVAVENMAMYLEPTGTLGTDEHGQRMRANYLAAIQQIRRMIAP